MIGNETKAENSNGVRERLSKGSEHQSMESINIVKPDEIYSKGGAAEGEHVIEDEIKAENTNDVHERLMEDVWHQSMESVNIVELTEISNKEGAAKEEHVIDIKILRLMEVIEVSNSKEAKPDLKIQFLH